MSSDDKLNIASTLVDSQFIPDTHIQFAWDSVSLTSILSCPRRYQYQIVHGYISNNPSYAIALVFGILMHKGLEIYEKYRAELLPHDKAQFNMIRDICSLPATASLPTDTDIDTTETSEDDDGITARNTKIRTRYYLIRALVGYTETYRDDPCVTLLLPSGAPAVEYSFRVPLDISIAGTDAILCGHIDRIVEFNGYNYVTDYKSTKAISRQFFSAFDLSHQMTGYNIAGKIVLDKPISGVMIDAIALQVGGNKFARHFTKRTAGQEAEYLRTVRFAIDAAVKYYEDDYYPMNTSACFFCDFKDICRQPPEFRERYIKQSFTKKTGWNPLENR
jgi:PD-(D/E)XK nuclease superfamily